MFGNDRARIATLELRLEATECLLVLVLTEMAISASPDNDKPLAGLEQLRKAASLPTLGLDPRAELVQRWINQLIGMVSTNVRAAFLSKIL